MIKNIVLGWYRKIFNKNNELAEKRLAICDSCPHKVNLTKKESICSLCGCVLSAKVRVESEICHDNRW